MQKIDKKNNKMLIKKIKNKKDFDFSKDIILDDVSYIYSKKTPFEFKALNDINITIKSKKITCIIGTSGSGKSTLIQLLNGLIIPETGSVSIDDYKILSTMKKILHVKKIRKEIGLVFQFPEYQLFKETVEEDIAFGPIHLEEDKKKVYDEIPNLLKLVKLPKEYATRSPFELSGGQKRRVALAGIIAMNGNTLVLDEPTGGLDPKGEHDFISLFQLLNKKKKRIIMVTHNMDHVLKIADEVIVMHEGNVIDSGTPFKIFSNEKLLEKIEIEPPKLYLLMYKLKNKGINLLDKEIRTIDDFTKELILYKSSKRGKK